MSFLDELVEESDELNNRSQAVQYCVNTQAERDHKEDNSNE